MRTMQKMKTADSLSLVESQREVLESYSKYIAKRFKELGGSESENSDKLAVSLASLQEKLFKNIQIFLQIQELERENQRKRLQKTSQKQLELEFDPELSFF